MFDAATEGIRQWIAGLFVSAIKHTARPEDRKAAIQWLLESREILASDLGMAEKLKALNALIRTRAAVSAIATAVADAVKNYRSSKLPWPMKVAMPATFAAMPLVGLHGAGVAAFGSAIGLPVLLLVFLGTAGLTSILEAVATNPHSRAGIALVVASILQAEAARRAKADFRRRIAEEAAAPQAAPMPDDEIALRAAPRSGGYGMDGYAKGSKAHACNQEGTRLLSTMTAAATASEIGKPMSRSIHNQLPEGFISTI